MKLYGFPTSSATYRVRIALHLKAHTLRDGRSSACRRRNTGRRPTSRSTHRTACPSLELDDGTILPQSLAIIDYLEQIAPTPPVYPADPVTRASALAVAHAIAAEIHAVSNGSVTNYVAAEYGQSDAQLAAWRTHFLREGFRAIEQWIEPGPFAFGMEPIDRRHLPRAAGVQRPPLPRRHRGFPEGQRGG